MAKYISAQEYKDNRKSINLIQCLTILTEKIFELYQ